MSNTTNDTQSRLQQVAQHALNAMQIMTTTTDAAIRALSAGMGRDEFLHTAAECFDNASATIKETVQEIQAKAQSNSTGEGSNG